MDREAWRAVIHGVAKSQTQLSDRTELNCCSLGFILPWAEVNPSVQRPTQPIGNQGQRLGPQSHWVPLNAILRRQWHPIQYSCLESPWTEEPGGLQSMGSLESQTRLSVFTFTFHFHALKKEMATHSRVLAWRIPGTGEPGGPPSTGSHRVVHD